MSTFNSSQEQKQLLSSLHKYIRLNNWKEIKLTLDYANGFSSSRHLCSEEDGDIDTLSEPIILRPNSVGWTAIHFTVLHCSPSPDSSRWKWMIMRVLEEYYQHDHRKRNSQAQEAQKSMSTSISPFFKLTKAGHTSTDLFFAKRLFPFPFETSAVQEDASRLLNTIKTILRACEFSVTGSGHRRDEIEENNYKINGNFLRKENRKFCCILSHTIIQDLKRRIRSKLKSQNINESFNSPTISFIDEKSSGVGYENELLEVMSTSQHQYETTYFSSQYLENQGDHQTSLTITKLKEEDIQELINFWYDMEVLIMAAVHGTLSVECIGNDDVMTVMPMSASDTNTTNRRKWLTVHALAQTGCPLEIAELAVLLYPEQISEKDEHGNLPLHIACSSHTTSSFAEGDDLSWNRKKNSNGKNDYRELRHSCSPMMKCLLNVFPQATMAANSNHKFPITLALQAGKYWHTGIFDIFQANPMMLLTGLSRDIETNMHSFIVAAVSDIEAKSSEMPTTGDTRKGLSKKSDCMWRFFKNSTSKQLAQKESREELNKMKLTTIFELLRINPGACCE